MEIENKEIKAIKRKNFFTKIAAGLFGFVILKSIPFSGYFTKNKTTQVKPVVKLNPLAVSRNKTGIKNG